MPNRPSGEKQTVPPNDSTLWRRQLRQRMLALRDTLDAPLRADLSARIGAHLLARLLAAPPSSLGFCLPARGEYDGREVATRLADAGWQIVVPVAERVDEPMVFRHWHADAPVAPDRYGMPIPLTTTADPPSVLLIPLLAFDAAGFRLGYGGGYFDRTLAACRPRPWAIGVGFQLNRVSDIRPQAHDQACDDIVTELGWQPRLADRLDAARRADDHAH